MNEYRVKWSNNKEYRVDWSNYYEASSPTDALSMALADLETAIKFKKGATGFLISDSYGENRVFMDIEYDIWEEEDD